MKRLFILLAVCLLAIPVMAQTKEEKAAKAKALYENAKDAIETKDWVIIPEEVTDADGNTTTTNDASIFVAYEKTGLLLQGSAICGNSDTNLAEVSDYKVKYSKKGDMTVTFSILGRKLRGSFIIRIKHDTNAAEVIYTPSGSGQTLKRYRGPIVHTKEANYFKRSNAI